MAEYVKLTKKDVDFPKCCQFFLTELLQFINDGNVKDSTQVEKIVDVMDMPYCYDVIEMVIKTIKHKGYTVQIPAYKKEVTDNGTLFKYKWKISKNVTYNNVDDLPF